jgi:pyruvate dehydrogenase E2 component (dihydrolipoamide acetyltransferase)
MHEVIMPKLGLTMESGVIEKWHKKEGDKVEKGDVLFEVMTDKVTVEVEAYDSGYLKKILTKEGEEVPVTEVVAYIGEKEEKLPEDIEKKVKPGQEKEKVAAGEGEKKEVGGKPVEDKRDKEKPKSTGGKIKISPLARKIAEEMNIDISEIGEGSGPGGRIIKEDILKYSESKGEQAEKKTTEKEPEATVSEIKIKSANPLKGMRKIIAERMSYSKTNIPHIVINSLADTTEFIRLREMIKDKIIANYGVKITYTDILLKICAVALRENIEVNSTLNDEKYIIYEDVNVGMAVSVEGGLIVPTIFNCDKLGILEIAKKRVELLDKVRNEKLKPDEIKNGTFTLTNMGMFGVRSFSAIINPPQAAILAVGEIYNAPAIVNEKVENRSFMNLSLSCDHRIIDGALGARFLQRVVELVENPEMLAI